MPLLKHATLGSLRGKEGEGVIQYLGLKYATLKTRLSESEVCEETTGLQVVDATSHGYETAQSLISAFTNHTFQGPLYHLQQLGAISSLVSFSTSFQKPTLHSQT